MGLPGLRLAADSAPTSVRTTLAVPGLRGPLRSAARLSPAGKPRTPIFAPHPCGWFAFIVDADVGGQSATGTTGERHIHALPRET